MNLKVETEHFVIDYNKTDEPCIDEVLDLLENKYSLITKRLDTELKHKTQVKICSDKEELQQALEINDAPEWIRGGMNANIIAIISPLNPPLGSTYENVVNTVVHEFVHVLLSQMNTSIPRWLEEGVASYEGKDNNPKWIANTVKNGVIENKVPTLTDLDTKEDFAVFFNKDGYQYAYTIIEFIVTKFGYPSLIKLITAPDEIETILKMTEIEFYNQWINFLKESYVLNINNEENK